MAGRIEDYAIIGDRQSAALVGLDGSIDWLCLPRFDSGACFAALLGTPEHGRWLIRPVEPVTHVERRYREGTLILETRFRTESGGEITLIDFMPPRRGVPDVVRIVAGVRETVRVRLELVLRFDYGSIVPWVRRMPDGLRAIAGPDMVVVSTPVELHGENFHTVAEFDVAPGETVPFRMTWFPSHHRVPPPIDPLKALAECESEWLAWSSRCTFRGPHREDVLRSLAVLRAMTFEPTGGIVAAPTASLPERVGGSRNWDYRYCWLRDSTFCLMAFMEAGYVEEARAWREWLLRAVAGMPAQTQIMYGVAGERRLTEIELPWLPGYEGSRPVRVGNAASTQFQLDVYGEVLDTLHQCRKVGLHPLGDAWALQKALLEFLESKWSADDEGIWEVRGPRRDFTHSKMMAWVAFDRAVKAVEMFGEDGPVERWRALAARIHDDVCRNGFNPDLGAFTQSYGSTALDASLLMMPLVGFLPAGDPRVRGTVDAIERHLTHDGLVRRYVPDSKVEGFDDEEATFLPCSFWLVDNLALQGRIDEAQRRFERLLSLRNDVGLLAEQYDARLKRQLGNFPQAFSHIALVNSAANLERVRRRDCATGPRAGT